jgi:hypothetical protein
VELDNEALIEAFAARVDAATAAMLASASDAAFADLSIVNLILRTTIFGAVRNAFERDLSTEDQRAVREQLVTMGHAYLETVRSRNQRVAILHRPSLPDGAFGLTEPIQSIGRATPLRHFYEQSGTSPRTNREFVLRVLPAATS